MAVDFSSRHTANVKYVNRSMYLCRYSVEGWSRVFQGTAVHHNPVASLFGIRRIDDRLHFLTGLPFYQQHTT